MGLRQICFCVSCDLVHLFGVIADTRWRRGVRNNSLALHSYFQHRDGAPNSDMDLTLLQRLWFLPQMFLLNCCGRCEPYSIGMYLGAVKKPELLKCY